MAESIITSGMRGIGSLARRLTDANDPQAALDQSQAAGVALSTALIEEVIESLREDSGEKSDRATLSNKTYSKNVPVYRSIKLRADGVAKARMKVFAPAGEEKLEWLGEDDPLQRFLDRVNDGDWTSADMWRAVQTYLCIWGSGPRWLNMPEPRDLDSWEMWPLYPNKLTVVPDKKTGGVLGYIYDRYGANKTLLPEEVLMDKYFNPANHRTGLSPLMVAMDASSMLQNMQEFNERIFRLGMLPSNLAFFMGPLSTPNDVDRFRQRLQDRYAGVENSQVPLVSTGEGTVQTLGLSQRDMEYVQGIRLAKQDIYDAFGVPEELSSGAPRSTYNNRALAVRDFYTNVVVGEWVYLERTLKEQLGPLLPAQYDKSVFHFDTDEIHELQETREDRYKRELAQIKQGVITINEVRAGYGWKPVEWGDYPPDNSFGQYVASPGDDEDEDDDDQDDDRLRRTLNTNGMSKELTVLLGRLT